MRATRTFRLTRTESVLVSPVLGHSLARGVIAGEACTELGCDPSGMPGVSWLERWLGIGGKAPGRSSERKDHGT